MPCTPSTLGPGRASAQPGTAGLVSSAGRNWPPGGRSGSSSSGLWGVGLLLLVEAGLALKLTRRQASGRLRCLVTVAGWAVSLVLLLRGIGIEVLLLSGFYESNSAVTSSQVYWSLVLWNPWFILGGMAFALASLTARDRGRVPPS